MNVRYEIGQQFIAQGKAKHLETIIDVLYTYNSKNELVKLEYLCEYEFLGQKIQHTVNNMTLDRARSDGRFKL